MPQKAAKKITSAEIEMKHLNKPKMGRNDKYLESKVSEVGRKNIKHFYSVKDGRHQAKSKCREKERGIIKAGKHITSSGEP